MLPLTLGKMSTPRQYKIHGGLEGPTATVTAHGEVQRRLERGHGVEKQKRGRARRKLRGGRQMNKGWMKHLAV